MSDNIKVVVKVRPLITRELEDKLTYQWRVKSNTLYQLDQGKETGQAFTFDKVYDEGTKTTDVYKDVAKPIVEAATAGINGTIFAYGQTSSGKTYTMTGTAESPGIIPLAVQDLFQMIKNIPDRDFLVRVSYIELYNETINDLINIEKRNVKIYDTLQGIKVEAEEKMTSTPEEVLNIMEIGQRNRHVGSTNMNDESSRSHSIFQITIESRDHLDGEEEGGCVNVSQLNLVDLAGSERAGQTGAKGMRFVEGTHINKSLSTLALVIRQLTEEPRKFTSYRDSKLTRILQNSLGGNARTCIICAITPATLEETISTLQFANRAKAIKNKPEVNAVTTSNTMIQNLTKQMCKLQSQLESKKNLEKDNVNLQKQLATLQQLIINGFNQRSTKNIAGTGKKQSQLRRVTISSLPSTETDIQDSPPPKPKFCTPLLKYNPACIQGAPEFSSTQNSIKPALPTVHEEGSNTVTPPRQKKTYFDNEIIEIDSGDEENASDIQLCSPTHECYLNTKTPPCILRKTAKQIEKNLKEHIEMTQYEKMYAPEVFELVQQLEEKTSKITELKEEINFLKKQNKDKDFEVEVFKSKVQKMEEEIKRILNDKTLIESQCSDLKTKLTDCEVLYESLKKKFKLREDELLLLLEEEKSRKPCITSFQPQKTNLTNFLDLSKDFSLVNSDNENSVVIQNDNQTLVEKLKAEIDLRNQTILENESDISKLNLKVNELEKTIKKLLEEMTYVDEDRTKFEKNNENLQSTIESLKAKIIIQESDISSYNNLICELQNKVTNKDLTTMYDSYSSVNNNEHLKIISDLKKVIEDRDNEINVLNTKIKAFEMNDQLENDDLKQHLEEKLDEIKLLKSQISSLEQQNNEHVKSIEILSGEKELLLTEQTELNTKISEIKEEISKLSELNIKNNLLVEDLTSQNLLLHQANQDYEIKLSASETKFTAFSEDSKQKFNQINEKLTLNNNQTTEYLELIKINNAKIEQLEENNKKLNDVIVEKDNEIQVSRQLLNEYKEQLLENQKYLEDLSNTVNYKENELLKYLREKEEFSNLERQLIEELESIRIELAESERMLEEKNKQIDKLNLAIASHLNMIQKKDIELQMLRDKNDELANEENKLNCIILELRGLNESNSMELRRSLDSYSILKEENNKLEHDTIEKLKNIVNIITCDNELINNKNYLDNKAPETINDIVKYVETLTSSLVLQKDDAMAKLSESMSMYTIEIANLRNELDTVKGQSSELHIQLEKLNNENASLSEELNCSRKNIVQLKENLTQLSNQHKSENLQCFCSESVSKNEIDKKIESCCDYLEKIANFVNIICNIRNKSDAYTELAATYENIIKLIQSLDENINYLRIVLSSTTKVPDDIVSDVSQSAEDSSSFDVKGSVLNLLKHQLREKSMELLNTQSKVNELQKKLNDLDHIAKTQLFEMQSQNVMLKTKCENASFPSEYELHSYLCDNQLIQYLPKYSPPTLLTICTNRVDRLLKTKKCEEESNETILDNQRDQTTYQYQTLLSAFDDLNKQNTELNLEVEKLKLLNQNRYEGESNKTILDNQRDQTTCQYQTLLSAFDDLNKQNTELNLEIEKLKLLNQNRCEGESNETILDNQRDQTTCQCQTLLSAFDDLNKQNTELNLEIEKLKLLNQNRCEGESNETILDNQRDQTTCQCQTLLPAFDDLNKQNTELNLEIEKLKLLNQNRCEGESNETILDNQRDQTTCQCQTLLSAFDDLNKQNTELNLEIEKLKLLNQNRCEGESNETILDNQRDQTTCQCQTLLPAFDDLNKQNTELNLEIEKLKLLNQNRCEGESNETILDNQRDQTTCQCQTLLSAFDDLNKQNTELNLEIEKLKLANQSLIDEQEEVRAEIELLLEPTKELQKKVLNHRTNLSTLTATTYAENQLLQSQVKSLQHHHSRFYNVCLRDIPDFKKQLQELVTILKDDQSYCDKHNISIKRFSLPDILDTNCSFPNVNESTLDGDLLMLDTNVTLTTNNTLGLDQTCFDVTQAIGNEVNVTVSTNGIQSSFKTDIPTELSIVIDENMTSAQKDTDNLHNSSIKIRSDIPTDNKNQDLLQEIDRLSQDLSTMSGEKSEIETKYKNLMSETSITLLKINDLEQQITNKDNEIKKLRKTLDEKMTNLSELQVEYDDISTQVMDHISEIDSLKEEIKTQKQINSELEEKCLSLENDLRDFDDRLKASVCTRRHASVSHIHLNRSLSDSDSSSSYNKMCTLQNELCAGKEECKQLTEEVTTIKNHLEQSNISAMELDESMDAINVLTAQNDQIITESLQPAKEKLQECLEYISEKTGCPKSEFDNNVSLIDLMKLLYSKLLLQHSNEIENITNHVKILDLEKVKLEEEICKLKEELHETNKKISFAADNNLLSQLKNNINIINIALQNFEKCDENLIISFKDNVLKIIDSEYKTNSACIFSNIIKSIAKKNESCLSEIMEKYTQLQAYMETLVAENSAVHTNLTQLKNAMDKKEEEYSVLKIQNEKIYEISNAVTLSIVKKEKEFNEFLINGCKKLMDYNITCQDFDIHSPVHKNLDILFTYLVNHRNSEQNTLMSEIKTLKELLNIKDQELEKTRNEIQSLNENTEKITSNALDYAKKLESQNTLYEDLKTIYNKKVEESVAQIQLIEKLTEEILILKQTLSNNEEKIKSLEYEAKKEIICNKCTEKEIHISELLSKINIFESEVKQLKIGYDVINTEKDALSNNLLEANNTIRLNAAEIDKLNADIMILKESATENIDIIKNLKEEVKSLLDLNLKLKEQFEEKYQAYSRLEINIKTHEKTAEIQSKMIKRLKTQHDAALQEKVSQIEELTTKLSGLQKDYNDAVIESKTAKEHIEELQGAKEKLEQRIAQLEMELEQKPRLSLESNADHTKKRRQSLHDSKRIFSDQVVQDNNKLEALFEARPKLDELFMDVDEDYGSNRSSPIKSRKNDSNQSKFEEGSDDSRPSSVMATRRRRQSTHDLHRSVVHSPHDQLSIRIEDTENIQKIANRSSSESEVSLLKHRITSYLQEIEELKERNRELDEECDTCAEYLKERDEQCARLRKEKTSLEKIIEELKENLKTYSLQQNQLAESKRPMVNASVNTDEDWANLHSIVVDRMSYDAQVEKNKRLTKVVEELRYKKQELSHTIGKMQAALDRQSRKDSHEDSKIRSELEAVKQELVEVKQRNKELDDECETCAQYLRESEQQCRKLKEAKDALEAKLEELQNDDNKRLSLRKKRQSIHDQNRPAKPELQDISIQIGDDLATYQLECEALARKTAEDARKLSRLKMAVDTLTQQKSALEYQLVTMKASMQPTYVATGSAIVQNQQITDVMLENQKLKKMNAKLVHLCKKRGKINTDSTRENEDSNA